MDKENTIGPVDLALLFLPNQELKPIYKVSTKSPALNKQAMLVGFPANWNGRFRETKGTIRGTKVVDTEYEFSKRAMGGESGGPLFVEGYTIAGIVSTRSDPAYPNATNVTTVPRIRVFLTSSIGGVPNCHKPVAIPIIPTTDSSLSLTEVINQLSKRIEVLESRIDELSKQKGPKGDMGKSGSSGVAGVSGEKGSKGEAGPAGSKGADGRDGARGPAGPKGSIGTVTVILVEDGVESKRVSNVRSGSTVRLNVKRLKQETK